MLLASRRKTCQAVMPRLGTTPPPQSGERGDAMWYVVQVVGGQEKRALILIEKLVSDGLLQECFIPQVEVMRRQGGQWRKRVEVLFPGYLVVVTDSPEQLVAALRKVPVFTKLLSNNDVFIPLNDQEISFFDAFTSSEHRIVTMSEGVIEGEEIVILKGPLVGRTGLIKKIDRHKRLAYLEVEIMGRKKIVKLGLEIVYKKQ